MNESAPLRASAEELVDELNEITKGNIVDEKLYQGVKVGISHGCNE
jgi:hypothetical protein